MKNINYIHHMPYLRNSIAYDHEFWHIGVKWWYLQAFFFIFCFILIFWTDSKVKGQEMVQNGKKFCLLHSISQEPYIMWLWNELMYLGCWLFSQRSSIVDVWYLCLRVFESWTPSASWFSWFPPNTNTIRRNLGPTQGSTYLKVL